MGPYLSCPITEKSTETGRGNRMMYAASSMQGWRSSQEDAFNSLPEFDDNTSFFAVYDGHGGHEVSEYLSKYFPNLLKSLQPYKEGDYREALSKAFLQMDESFRSPDILAELQKIAKSVGEAESSGADYVEENICALYEEADMPLHKLVKKYERNGDEKLEEEGTEENSEEQPGPCTSKSLLMSMSRDTSEQASSSHAKDVESQPGHSKPGSSKEFRDTCEVTTSSCNKTNSNETNGEGSTSSSASCLKQNGDVLNGENVQDLLDEKETEEVEGDSNEPGPTKKDEATLKDSESKSENIIEIAGSKASKIHVPFSSIEEATSQFKRRLSPRKIMQQYRKMFAQSLEQSSDSEDDDEEEDEDVGFELAMGDSDSDSDQEEDEDDSSTSSDLQEDLEEAEREQEDEDDKFLSDSLEPGYDSGSTAVVALMKWENDLLKVWIANAGDSRCVLCREGKALDLSYDHKPESEEEAKRIVRAGGKVSSDGRVNGGLNLSRALGDHTYKLNEELPLQEQMITSLPSIEEITVDPKIDEFLVLACDGIWNSMSSQEVVDFVKDKIENTEDSIRAVNEALFTKCLAPDTHGDGTGCDNMTSILIKFPPKKPEANLKRNLDSADACDEEGTAEKKIKLSEDVNETSIKRTEVIETE